MALYNRGALPPTASVISPEYRRAAFQHYQADLAPVRRQALSELSDEYGDRGLSASGGQAVAGRLQSRGDFMQRLAQQRQGIGMQQAGQVEGNRERLEDRSNQVQDQNAEYGLEDELRRYGMEDRANSIGNRSMGILMGGIGKIGGTLAGDYFGGGDKLGKGFSGQELKRIRVRPDTGQLDAPSVGLY